jgi:hypothetical protein
MQPLNPAKLNLPYMALHACVWDASHATLIGGDNADKTDMKFMAASTTKRKTVY